MLILDEPTSSLDDVEVEKLFTLMRSLRDKGVGIVFVTHFLEQVYAVCDRITVLRNGTLVGEYPVAELPRVKLVAAMMGKDFDDLASIKPEGFTTTQRLPWRSRQRGSATRAPSSPLTWKFTRARSSASPASWAPAAASWPGPSMALTRPRQVLLKWAARTQRSISPSMP